MSSCQHPNCSYAIYSICANHCHWSLCEKHIDEHRKSLIVRLEELLEDLVEPTNELLHLFELKKHKYCIQQEKQLDSVKQIYEKEICQIKEELTGLTKFQDECNKISENLSRIKANEILLTHNDFQRIDTLSKQIVEYSNSLQDKEDTKLPVEEIQDILQKCPLITLGVYGLSLSHNVPLCCPRKRIRRLFHHLCNYHHLTPHYADELIKAIKLKLDPVETKIFPLNTQISARGIKHPCPLHDKSTNSGILSTPCTTMVTDKFLPIHLRTVHRLRATQINELLKKH